MAPKRGDKSKKSAVEDAAQLSLREQEKIKLANEKKCKSGMKWYPELPGKLVRYAEQLGYDLDVEPETDATPKKSTQKESQEKRLEKLRQNSHSEARKMLEDENNKGILPENYQTLEDFSVTMLREDCPPPLGASGHVDVLLETSLKFRRNVSSRIRGTPLHE